MFKYLVTMEDPQRWFSIGVILVNFVCFVIITICYIIINSTAAPASKNISKSAKRRNLKLQAKISFIILTDFLCWVPFITVCLLHFGGATDATSWYPIFSTIILPINSVINPLLYNNTITDFLAKPGTFIYRQSMALRRTIRGTPPVLQSETEMTEMPSRLNLRSVSRS